MASPTRASASRSRAAPGPRAIPPAGSSGARTPANGVGARLRARLITIAQNFDLALLVAGVPVALVLGAPVLGCLVGAGAWVAQRVVAVVDRRWIRSAAEPRTQLGLALFEAFGRIWLLAGAIVVAGVAGSRASGLAAALTIFGAYSVAFAIRVLSGPPAPGRKATS